ncbi:hypothetical protein WMY93_023820 [Mugilogobius chulae]|uniref:Uncharacterized protein n=1 Tax=Mugilogobius chulae TaxID=88201 RepID=A0AAW0NHI5_9GOBI
MLTSRGHSYESEPCRVCGSNSHPGNFLCVSGVDTWSKEKQEETLLLAEEQFILCLLRVNVIGVFLSALCVLVYDCCCRSEPQDTAERLEVLRHAGGEEGGPSKGLRSKKGNVDVEDVGYEDAAMLSEPPSLASIREAINDTMAKSMSEWDIKLSQQLRQLQSNFSEDVKRQLGEIRIEFRQMVEETAGKVEATLRRLDEAEGRIEEVESFGIEISYADDEDACVFRFRDCDLSKRRTSCGGSACEGFPDLPIAQAECTKAAVPPLGARKGEESGIQSDYRQRVKDRLQEFHHHSVETAAEETPPSTLT